MKGVIPIMLKNITLSAEAEHIERARQVAQAENRTLNQAFRDWLLQYQSRVNAQDSYRATMKKLAKVSSGEQGFSREEMNER